MKNKEFERFTVSMEEFVSSYLGLDYMRGTDSFDNLIRCTHKDLTELGIEGVKRVPFQSVSLGDLLRGDIIIVASGKKHGDIAPYINPRLLYEKENKTNTK